MTSGDTIRGIYEAFGRGDVEFIWPMMTRLQALDYMKLP